MHATATDQTKTDQTRTKQKTKLTHKPPGPGAGAGRKAGPRRSHRRLPAHSSGHVCKGRAEEEEEEEGRRGSLKSGVGGRGRGRGRVRSVLRALCVFWPIFFSPPFWGKKQERGRVWFVSRVALGFRCRRVRGWGAELKKKGGGLRLGGAREGRAGFTRGERGRGVLRGGWRVLRVRSEKGDWRRRRDAHLTLRLGEESFGRVDGYKKESRDPRRGTSAQRALGIFIPSERASSAGNGKRQGLIRTKGVVNRGFDMTNMSPPLLCYAGLGKNGFVPQDWAMLVWYRTHSIHHQKPL